MVHRIPITLVLLIGAFFTAPLLANGVGLSGVIDGDSDVIAALPGACQGAPNLPYEVVADLQVDESGNYNVSEVSAFLTQDLVIYFYEGAFNPQNPNQNLVDFFDFGGSVNLQAGTTYSVVVQNWCDPVEAAWYAVITGSGTITASNSVNLRSWQRGILNANDPSAPLPFCNGSRRYEIAGPFRVPGNGFYYYGDASIGYTDFGSDDGTATGIDSFVLVYNQPVNTNNFQQGLIGVFDDAGRIELEAGTDYYVLVTPFCDSPALATGEWAFVLAPQGPLVINGGLNDAWFNPATDGQGFFINVFEGVDFMFVGQFTFQSGGAAMSVTSDGRVGGSLEAVGDDSQRWLTANGSWDGNVATLDVVNTSGGQFDSATPMPTNTPAGTYGTMEIDFENDCINATVTYDLFGASPPEQGTIPLRRIVPDENNVMNCTDRGALPGAFVQF